jgi:dephospho-CoA kinase
MLIGITGQIGSGKSEVAKIFKRHGAFVISADKIGREVAEKKAHILHRLVRAFGDGILTRSGRLRRRELARRAFSSEKNRLLLNRIVHPPLLRELGRRTRIAARKHKLVVIDAALLLDWNWDKRVDLVIFVHAGDKVKTARLMSSGYSREEARQRIKSQLRFGDFKKRADITILNNKSLESLELKVKGIIRKLI